MPIKTVGIVSPGDMGQAIAVVLSQQGLRTICALLLPHHADAPNVANASLSQTQQRFAIAALDERSKRTRQLAAAATIEDVGSLKHLVAESDVVLSVLVPAAATQADQKVALAIRALDKPILYADCNAIASFRSHPLTYRGDRNTL